MMCALLRLTDRHAAAPIALRELLERHVECIQAMQTLIDDEKRIMVQHRRTRQAAETIPGIALWGDLHHRHGHGPKAFRWVVICGSDRFVPRQIGPAASEARANLKTDRYCYAFLAGLYGLAVRAPAAKKYPWPHSFAHRPFRVVMVALADNIARIAWALLAKAAPIWRLE
jgi:hypothetical protein